jgi:glucose 1-dehydrogenase
VRAIVVRPPAPGAELVEVPSAPLPPGGVRVEVLEVGVCGTDLDIVAGRYGRAPEGSPYLILGHENVGTVVEVASGASPFAPGDLVVATVRRGCGRCRFCWSNRSDFCETDGFTERGIRGAHGYLADEYVELPEYLVPVPPNLQGVAVLLEPLSVVEKAVAMGQQVVDRKEPTPGFPRTSTPSALVAGTGAVGMLAALVLRIRGYGVTAVDRHGDTTLAAELLRRVGARHADVSDGVSVLRPAKFDLVIEASGSALLDLDLVDVLGPNAALVLTGIPDPAAPATPVHGGALFRGLVLGNQAVVGSVNANRTYFESGLRDLAAFEERWPGAVGRMISARRPLEEFGSVLGPRVGGTVKTVLAVRPGGAGVLAAR